MNITEEMVERAAKDLYERQYKEPTWHDLGPVQETYRRRARAALEAALTEDDTDCAVDVSAAIRAQGKEQGSVSDIEQEARVEVDRLMGWKHLRKYGRQSAEWMDSLRDGIVRVVLEASEWCWSRRMFRPELATGGDGHELDRWKQIEGAAAAEADSEWEYGRKGRFVVGGEDAADDYCYGELDISQTGIRFLNTEERDEPIETRVHYYLVRRRKAGPWEPMEVPS